MSQNDENWDKLISFDGELITYKKVVIFMKELINDYDDQKMKEFIEACDKEKMQEFIEACDRVWKEIIEANKEEILEKVEVCKKERQDFFDHVFNYPGGPYDGWNPIVFKLVVQNTGIMARIRRSPNKKEDLEDFLSYVKMKIYEQFYDYRYSVCYNDKEEKIPYALYLFGFKNLNIIWKKYKIIWKKYKKYSDNDSKLLSIDDPSFTDVIDPEDLQVYWLELVRKIFATINTHIQNRTSDKDFCDSHIQELVSKTANLEARISENDLNELNTLDIISEKADIDAIIYSLRYIKKRIDTKVFPIDEEIMMCIQFFQRYEETIDKHPDVRLNEQTDGFEVLNQTALQEIRRNHTDVENQELPPEDRLRNCLKDSLEKVMEYCDTDHIIRGSNDPITGKYKPSKERIDSTHGRNRENRKEYVYFWELFCPIHDPQALADLLAIDSNYEACNKYVELYLNFIVNLIWPGKWRELQKKSPTIQKKIPKIF